MAESPKATERQARTPLPPQKESPFKRPRMQLCCSILGLLAANYLFVAIFAPGGPEPVRIPYSPTFLEQVRDGNVERVSTQGETVDGIFKKEFKYEDAEPTKNFDTEIPTFALASDDLNQLLEDKGVIIEAEPVNQSRGFLASLILGFGPVILLIALFVFLARRAGGGGAMGALGNFGRSRARRVEGGEQKVTFKDVAGIDESKAELTEIVDFLKNPEKYQRLGGRIPRGVLLSGRPGTGKTLLARAVAGEAEAPFFSISASEFVEAIVGIGASRVRDLFKQAKEAAPAIVFIDELDAIGRSRSTGASFGGGNDEREQTLNQILTEMDGFESNVAVIVLGATNRPEILDAALLRPGRFDRRIAVPPPDREGRAQILGVHTRSLPLAEDVSLDRLAATTPGMVGADLANLANEAALMAARRGHDKVEMADFTDAMEKIVLGSPARHGALRRGAPARRLPRGRARARRHAHARRRPRPQGLDHPARPGAGRHVRGPRRRPLQLRGGVAAGEDRGRARRPRRGGDRVRDDHHGRGVRHPAAHADRARDGRPVGDEPRDRPDRRAPAGGQRHAPARRRPAVGDDAEAGRRRGPAHRGGVPRARHPAADRPPRSARVAHRGAACGGDARRGRGLRGGSSPPRRCRYVAPRSATSPPTRGCSAS